MDNRNNKILLGIILLILGVASLMQIFIDINFGKMTIFFLGFALLLIYKTKRKSWALVVGTYLMFFGLNDVLKQFGIDSTIIISVSTFFIVPGIIFLILFLQKNKRGLLYPGSFLTWIGIYLFLSDLNIDRNNGGLFLICLGLSFLTIYLLGKFLVSNSLAIVGIILIFIGLTKYASINIFSYNINLISVLFASILIIIAIKLIFGSNRK